MNKRTIVVVLSSCILFSGCSNQITHPTTTTQTNQIQTSQVQPQQEIKTIFDGLPTKWVQQIEQATGKKASDITEQDLLKIEELHFDITEVENKYATEKFDLSFIGKMHNLKKLDIKYVVVKELEFINNLTNLVDLHLDTFGKIDLSTNFSNFTKMESLSLENGYIKDLQFLEGMPNLENLTLRLNGIKDISSIKSLKQLQTLNLSDNLFTDVSPLSGLPLKSLDIHFTNVEEIKPILEISSLKTIILTKSRIKDYDLLAGKKGLNITSIEPKKLAQ